MNDKLQSQPLASVVVLNYKSMPTIEQCIDGLMQQTILNRLEIILVDQNSPDEGSARIRALDCPYIRIITLQRNVGFAEGCNIGGRAARGRYLLLLNSDAIPDPQWAESLVSAMENEPELGMCSSKILYLHDSNRIESAGHVMYPDGLNRSLYNMAPNRGKYLQPVDVLFPSGCAACYRRDEYLKVGGIDKEVFFYGDDADIGMKMRLRGHRARYVPEAEVRHYGSLSYGSVGKKKIFLIERNRVLILLKYFPWLWILASPWFTLKRLFLGWKGARSANGIARDSLKSIGAPVLTAIILSAWLNALILAPLALWRRFRFRSLRRCSNACVADLLRTFRAGDEEISFSHDTQRDGL